LLPSVKLGYDAIENKSCQSVFLQLSKISNFLLCQRKQDSLRILASAIVGCPFVELANLVTYFRQQAHNAQPEHWWTPGMPKKTFLPPYIYKKKVDKMSHA
jgi:hypothetical protein